MMTVNFIIYLFVYVLLVLCLMYLVYCSSIVPPSSARIGGNRRIVYTSSLSLTCSALGTIDHYKWYHNSSLLTTTVYNSYVKSLADLSDSGSYQCEACNNLAHCSPKSNSYTVRVAGLFMCMNSTLCIFVYISVHGWYVPHILSICYNRVHIYYSI